MGKVSSRKINTKNESIFKRVFEDKNNVDNKKSHIVEQSQINN